MSKSPELFIMLKIHLFNDKKFQRVPNKDYFWSKPSNLSNFTIFVGFDDDKKLPLFYCISVI